MSKKVSIGAVITLMAITAALTFSMTIVYYEMVFNDKMSNLQAREAMYNKLSQVDQLFRNNYVGEIDETKLRDMLSSGYVRGTGDLYARYYTAEDYKKELALQAGRVMSVGAVTDKDPSGYLIITDIYSGSAAETAELRKGDLIVAVDGVEVNEKNVTQMQELLQGENGTKVTLTIRRDSEDTEFPITRRYVDIPSVFPKMLSGNIGYLRVSELSDTTDEQFNKQLEKLIAQNATSLILDLRGTADGITESAIHILDRMLPVGVAVTATYRDGTEKVFEMSDSKTLGLPVVILTNEKTAREAEIIAQVMKDYGGANVRTVGTKTLGKGTRQEFRTPEGGDGSAILLTVATYKTSKGETFNLTGVKPDYEVTLTAEEEKNFANLDENSDPQLKKAIEAAQGLARAGVESGASSGEPVATSSASSAASVESAAVSSTVETAGSGSDEATSEATSEAASGSTPAQSSSASSGSESAT